MKTTHRIPKAIAIVIILGFGMIYNMEKKHYVMQSYSRISSELENSVESDTVETFENKLYFYTKTYIKTSIQQLITKI